MTEHPTAKTSSLLHPSRPTYRPHISGTPCAHSEWDEIGTACRSPVANSDLSSPPGQECLSSWAGAAALYWVGMSLSCQLSDSESPSQSYFEGSSILKIKRRRVEHSLADHDCHWQLECSGLTCWSHPAKASSLPHRPS